MKSPLILLPQAGEPFAYQRTDFSVVRIGMLQPNARAHAFHHQGKKLRPGRESLIRRHAPRTRHALTVQAGEVLRRRFHAISL
jgi:hypothetical protein